MFAFAERWVINPSFFCIHTATKMLFLSFFQLQLACFENFTYFCGVNSNLRPWLMDQRVDTNNMVKFYIVNRIPQPTGEHEVHTLDCSYLPSLENRIPLGYFVNSRDAVQAARRHFVNIDGCFFCCPKSHQK